MIVGTCSICGGAVAVPDVWGGIIPPTPTCTGCGAIAATHGPVIQMQPPMQIRFTTAPSSQPFFAESMQKEVKP